MKNVLIVNLGKAYGGAEKYTEQLALLLNDSFNIFFLVRQNSRLEKKLLIGRNRVISIKFNGSSILSDLYMVKRFIKKNHINIIHTNGINSEFFISIGKKISTTENVRYITTVHGIAEYDRIESKKLVKHFFSRLQLWSIKNYDNIIAVSGSVKKDLQKKGVMENKIIIINHGIATKKNLSKYNVHNPFRICTVGRLEKIKNIDLLIRALHQLDKKGNMNFICNIYGDGSQFNNLSGLIYALGLTEKIKLKGYVEEVDNIYSTHDLMIQPSIYESFGMTLLEAMDAGIPVLCSNVGGMTEIVEDEINGLLFNPDSVKELSDKIEGCIYNIYPLEKIRTQAFDIVNKKYTLDIMKNRTKAVYENRGNFNASEI